MKTVRVDLGKRSYDILIQSGLLAQVGQQLERLAASSRLFLVSNPVVYSLFGEKLLEQLRGQGFHVTEILLPDGERSKTLDTVERAYTDLSSHGADRQSAVMALGGGVTGDIAGFVAATYMRGIPYLQIPTTLLAQVDSSVGGKTGVNHRAGKNMIGAFYQPTLVCIDPETLLTLPEREFRSGLFEVIKYGLIFDAEFFAFLELELENIQRRVPEVLEKVVARCCEIKSEITARDEKELDLRRILNLGHTFGHGLEAASEFQGFTHGEAVAYGMMAASHLSQHLGLLDAGSCHRIIEAILRIGDLPSIDTVPTQEVLDAMKLDKKRRGDRTVVILLEEIGRAVIRDDVGRDDLRQAWDRIKSNPSPPSD